MGRYIDRKFFKLIGIDSENFKKRILKIEKEYKMKIMEIDKNKIVLMSVLEKVFDENKMKVQKDRYRERMRETVCFSDVYQTDVETALFMLIGSYLSQWREAQVINENLPFRVVEIDKKKYVSLWCEAYQRVFTQDRFKNIFDNNSLFLQYIAGKKLISKDAKKFGRERIEKYSYKRVKKIIRELDHTIMEEIEDTTKQNIENYLVLDMTLGLSLTLTIYHYLRMKTEEQFKVCIPVIILLTNLKCYFLRNRIAEVVFSYLDEMNYSEEAIENVKSDLDEIVDAVNKAYEDMLNIEWYFMCREKIGKTEERKVWNEYIVENVFKVSEVPMEVYQEEIEEDMENEFDIPPVIKEKNFRNLEKAFKLCSLYRGMSVEDIQKDIEKKWNEEQEIRRSKKIKTKSTMYTKIHEIVVMVSMSK